MMSKRVFDFSLAIPVFVVFGGAYFSRTCFNGIAHHCIHIRNKQPDNGCYSLVSFRRKKIRFLCYFLQGEYSSVNRKFRDMKAVILVWKTQLLFRLKCGCIK